MALKDLIAKAWKEMYSFALISFIVGTGGVVFIYLPLLIFIAIATKLHLVDLSLFNLFVDHRVVVMLGVAFGIGFTFAKTKSVKKAIYG